MSSEMYRIAWKSLYTGFESHGEWCLSLKAAKAWLEQLEKGDPMLKHWIEGPQVPPESVNTQ
jgi:hypothetical protein